MKLNYDPLGDGTLQKVAGSPDLLQLKEFLYILLGSTGRRQLELRQLTNKDLFSLYEGELTFRHHSKEGLGEAKRVLNHFHNYIGEYPPSAELAKSFLSQFKDRKPATIARYGAILKVFLKWYGEELGITFKVPKTLPNYIQKDDIMLLQAAIASKKSHKKSVDRDLFLVDLAIHTGLRRRELANLKVKDIDLTKGMLVVRQGKGAKDRVIPLSGSTGKKLGAYTKDRESNESLFGLNASSISGKIKTFARKAGVELHTHSLRDYFATSLSEKGATIREIQTLLGHTNLTHTERYTLHTDKHLRKAVEMLDEGIEAGKTPDENREIVRTEKERPNVSEMQPMVTVKGIYKPAISGLALKVGQMYFSHFIISNEGKEPAIELEIGFLNSDRRSLQGRRETVLMVGEKLLWRPNLNRPDGHYYVVCQYKKPIPDPQLELWNQTWLPFGLLEGDQLGEKFIAPEQIVFTTNIKSKDKVAIF